MTTSLAEMMIEAGNKLAKMEEYATAMEELSSLLTKALETLKMDSFDTLVVAGIGALVPRERKTKSEKKIEEIHSMISRMQLQCINQVATPKLAANHKKMYIEVEEMLNDETQAYLEGTGYAVVSQTREQSEDDESGWPIFTGVEGITAQSSVLIYTPGLVYSNMLSNLHAGKEGAIAAGSLKRTVFITPSATFEAEKGFTTGDFHLSAELKLVSYKNESLHGRAVVAISKQH